MSTTHVLPSEGIPARRNGPGWACALAAVAFAACNSGGGGGLAGASAGGSAELVAMHYGRLVDVYGLQRTSSGSTLTLYRADVLIGSDIQDERDSNSNKKDDEILYDFIPANPDTLQQRLLITREIGTRAFEDAVAALPAKLRLVAPALFGQDTTKQPYTVVPRNAAIQLTFSNKLGVGDSFFVDRDANGVVTGLKNTEAVQLLRIVGDPLDSANEGDFEVVAVRVVVRDERLILDPVLLGNEGLQYQTRNNAAGLPEAPNQTGSNIRIALALAGPLRIPGLRADTQGILVGPNNSAQKSVVRDFRSGNRLDNTSDIAQGFVRDAIPPRIVGQIPMLLEKVANRDDFTQLLTLNKNGVVHEIDRGDAIRVVVDNSGVPVAVTEVVEDPLDDAGKPEVQKVNVIVRKVGGLANLFGDPSKPPRAVLVAEFTGEHGFNANNQPYGDDPRYFVTFSPGPLPYPDGKPSEPNQNISPFAAAIVRFTKPIDIATMRGLDTFFFGTRNLLDPVEVQDFITTQGIDPQTFKQAKFITPHLVDGKAFDEDGSQTAARLQPALGFYLDETMRQSPTKYHYFVHLLSGSKGVRDLSGNGLDFQSKSVSDFLVIEFSLDTRKNANSQPAFPDNYAVTIARRFEDVDEDEQPSYYMTDEVQKPAQQTNSKAYNLQDLFGAVVYLADGTLQARPATRSRKIVDDLNQLPPPSQTSNLRYCPEIVSGETQVATATGGTKFGAGIQNPLNPYGCHLQTVWREIDMSLSRTDPFDFNLDVEQMFWAPFTGSPITYDEFDQMSLFLGHSEWRPEPCVGAQQALASLPSSGLVNLFANNYVWNPSISGAKQTAPAPFPAYKDKNLVVDTTLAFTEPNGVNRFLPLPKFDKPYFVWRDETVVEQGCNSLISSDVTNKGATQTSRSMQPYILSPFLGGRGRFVTGTGTLTFNQGVWGNLYEYWINNNSRLDNATGGQVGTIGAPLLADFWSYPDLPNLPKDNPFYATGANGWQIALAVTSGQQPNFRALSSGGLIGGNRTPLDPTKTDWNSAVGGYTPTGTRTSAADNSVYWVMADFVKRQTVVTSGFVDILNPHRMPAAGGIDPRLGPYFAGTLPANTLPKFAYDFEPPLTSLPSGTAVITEFRGAGPVDTLSRGFPWRAAEENYDKAPNEAPNAQNFPLDPLKAGDAHIRKYDDRPIPPSTQPRNTWTYYYNRNITNYRSDPNQLMDPRVTALFAGPTETFQPQDVKYINWRFIMRSNVDAKPPVSPRIQSFTMSYRFERIN